MARCTVPAEHGYEKESLAVPMKRIHIAIGVADVQASTDDYSHRLGCPPSIVVHGEYALWRTPAVNFSIRRSPEGAGTVRHLGWEDESAAVFTQETDVNGIIWEHFSAQQQEKEIDEAWPARTTVRVPSR